MQGGSPLQVSLTGVRAVKDGGGGEGHWLGLEEGGDLTFSAGSCLA